VEHPNRDSRPDIFPTSNAQQFVFCRSAGRAITFGAALRFFADFGSAMKRRTGVKTVFDYAILKISHYFFAPQNGRDLNGSLYSRSIQSLAAVLQSSQQGNAWQSSGVIDFMKLQYLGESVITFTTSSKYFSLFFIILLFFIKLKSLLHFGSIE